MTGSFADEQRRGGRPDVPAHVDVLEPFVRTRILDATDVHLAAAIARLADLDRDDEADRSVILALAAASAGVRRSHVCLELDSVGEVLADPSPDNADTARPPPWPEAARWLAALDGHRLVATADRTPPSPDVGPVPLVIDRGRLYLQRLHHDETIVRDQLLRRAAATVEPPIGTVDRILDEVFAAGPEPSDSQRDACRVALTTRFSVIAGGPGTGKTWTVARVLAGLGRLDPDLDAARVALCAPTGKAAARMSEALGDAAAGIDFGDTGLGAATASTIHSLIGMSPGRAPRHDAANPLPHTVVVVDETSMLSLSDMARLVEAVRPDARLVLLGDPNQLASVEAGTVLRDIVDSAREPGDHTPLSSTSSSPRAPLHGRIVELDRGHRFNAEIGALADAIREGDTARATGLLSGSGDTLRLVDPHDQRAVSGVIDAVGDSARQVLTRARSGDAAGALAASVRHKILTATRQGPMSRADWDRRITGDLRSHGFPIGNGDVWYAGRPVLVTVNDYINDVRNGDTGVTVDDDGDLRVAFAHGDDVRHLSTAQLAAVQTWWAMTIHKSQGSEFDHVVVSVPRRSSRILTRELLYTAVTRARRTVTIVATGDVLRDAIDTPVVRTSGLRDRLGAGGRGAPGPTT